MLLLTVIKSALTKLGHGLGVPELVFVLGRLIDALCWTLAGQQLHGSLDILQLLNGQTRVLHRVKA